MDHLNKLTQAASQSIEKNADKVITAEDQKKASSAARAIGHRLNMLTTMFMTITTGDPEQLEAFSNYWDEVVDLIADRMNTLYPERRGEIAPEERGVLQNSTRLIARDGFRSGVPADVYLKPFLESPFLDRNANSFTSSPMQSEPVYMLFSNLKGIQKISSSVYRFLREVDDVSEKALEAQELTKPQLVDLITGGQEVEEIARYIYSQVRKKMEIVAAHLAKQFNDDSISNSATISNLANSANEALVSNMKIRFHEFMMNSFDTNGDPVKSAKIVQSGALIPWLENIVDHHCAKIITIAESHEQYLTEGLALTEVQVKDREEVLKRANDRVALGKILEGTTNVKDAESGLEKQYKKGSFADKLQASGVKFKTSKPADMEPGA